MTTGEAGAPATKVASTESPGRAFGQLVRVLVPLLLLVGVPLAGCAALAHFVFAASWFVSCLVSPAALLAIVVYAWIQQKGSSGSYGTYSNVQKLFGRKP